MKHSIKINLYVTFVTFFCLIVVVSNFITVKLFQAPFLHDTGLPAGLITYPATFLICDLVTEVYGYRSARFMIYLGFVMSIISYFIVRLAIALPPFETSDQVSFETVFGINGLAVFGSMVAYVVAQIVDITVFSYLKKLTKQRYLWLRNVVSTLLSQLIDTAIVTLILLHWGFGLEIYLVSQVIFISYFYKGIITIINVPIFYLSVYLTRFMINYQKQ